MTDETTTDDTPEGRRSRLLSLLRRLALEEGDFELSSGGSASVYVDVRQVSLTAPGADLIGQSIWEKIRQVDPEARAVGGLTLGADPIVTATSLAALADDYELSGILVRKASKEHGTGERVEAPAILSHGDRVVAVEDTVTTGNSTLEAIEQMRQAGFDIEHAVCVVDREAGGADNLAEAGVALHSIFTLSDLLNEAE